MSLTFLFKLDFSDCVFTKGDCIQGSASNFQSLVDESCHAKSYQYSTKAWIVFKRQMYLSYDRGKYRSFQMFRNPRFLLFNTQPITACNETF